MGLRCEFGDGYGRLDFVRDLPRLKVLGVSDLAGYDLPTLAYTGLKQLALTGPPLPQSIDLAPLAEVRGLTSIEARIETHGWAALASLPRLKDLQLTWIDDPARLADLTALTGLRSLSLGNVFGLTDLTPLAFLTAPVSLSFQGCQALRDVSLLRRWADRLGRLRLIACPAVDPAPIGELTELRLLDLTGVELTDLSMLSGLKPAADAAAAGAPHGARPGTAGRSPRTRSAAGDRVGSAGPAAARRALRAARRGEHPHRTHRNRLAGTWQCRRHAQLGRSRFGTVIDHISVTTEAGSFDAIAAGPEDGRPVMLLHGFPEAAVEWEHQVATLGVLGYRAVAPDQRGYSPGVRPEPAADYRIDHLVGDVIAIADRFGWGSSTSSGTTGVGPSPGGPPTRTPNGCAAWPWSRRRTPPRSPPR